MGALCAELSLPTAEQLSGGSWELEHCTDLSLTRPKCHFTSLPTVFPDLQLPTPVNDSTQAIFNINIQ